VARPDFKFESQHLAILRSRLLGCRIALLRCPISQPLARSRVQTRGNRITVGLRDGASALRDGIPQPHRGARRSPPACVAGTRRSRTTRRWERPSAHREAPAKKLGPLVVSCFRRPSASPPLAHSAISSASIARSLRSELETRHPTICLENTSVHVGSLVARKAGPQPFVGLGPPDPLPQRLRATPRTCSRST